MEEEQKIKKSWINPLLKVLLSLIALYIVYSRIDVSETLRALGTINPVWLLLATIFFILSKMVSAVRLNKFFNAIGVILGQVQN